MIIRKANMNDTARVAEIYEEIHDGEEKGLSSIGWIRGVYPTIDTAVNSVKNDELFVMEDDGIIVASARINQIQDEMYQDGNWLYDAKDDEVMVLHTLTVSPNYSNKGYAKAFIKFYEDYAKEHNMKVLRIDTNERNTKARSMYERYGYRCAGVVPCEFNGIKGVNLVLLEKVL